MQAIPRSCCTMLYSRQVPSASHVKPVTIIKYCRAIPDPSLRLSTMYICFCLVANAFAPPASKMRGGCQSCHSENAKRHSAIPQTNLPHFRHPDPRSAMFMQWNGVMVACSWSELVRWIDQNSQFSSTDLIAQSNFSRRVLEKKRSIGTSNFFEKTTVNLGSM